MRKLLLLGLIILIPFIVFADTISVVSINVWSGLEYKGVFSFKQYEDSGAKEFRDGLLLKELVELTPDLIGLNEANTLPKYADTLAETLEYTSVSHIALGGVRIARVGFPINLREGDAFLASPDLSLENLKRKMLSGGGSGNIFSFQFGKATQVIAGKITVEGRIVFVFNTNWHNSPFADKADLTALVNKYSNSDLSGDELLDSLKDAVKGYEIRMEEARKTLDFINEIAGESPVIFMGTLNALPSSDEISMFLKAGFKDAWAGNRSPGYTRDETVNTNIITYLKDEDNSTRRRDRINYIFIRGEGISVRNAELCFNKPTYDVYPSDHFGIIARIEILPEKD